MTEPTDPLDGLIEPTEHEDHSPLEKPGNKIGPYRLLQVLGSGGFGEVWLAERREPFIQRVALKVVKPGMDTKMVLSRFEQERQVLAQMSHPNIAKVLDAGVNEQGRPYFVMEYVPGKPITEFADEHKLSIQTRLEYFLQVCNAIAHAHQKGVIHRDIKPGNILVSRGEIGEVGTGSSITTGSSAKVIDFGVAKAMAVGMTEQTVFTQIGQGIGTWGYMSPEQIEGDTQIPSDVYSLGVLLYELICGQKPYDISSMRNFSPKERADFIRGVEAIPPSKRLSNAIPEQKSRNISTTSKVKQLRELDWVCLKALSPEVKGRYLTVHSLAEDVQRFISGEQVEAAPVSIGTQVQRFWRRNSVAVVAVLSAVLLLTVGGSFAAKKVAEYRSIVKELSVAENQHSEALSNLAVRESELEELSEKNFIDTLNLIEKDARAFFTSSDVTEGPSLLSPEIQVWRAIFGKGAVVTEDLDQKSFQVLNYSESGLWAVVAIESDDQDKYALVNILDGVPQVVSSIPQSLLSDFDFENEWDRLVVSEDDSGTIYIARFLKGRILVARYEQQYGPIEERNVLEIECDDINLSWIWYSKGAVLTWNEVVRGLDEYDPGYNNALAILDLSKLNFNNSFEPSRDLILFDNQVDDAVLPIVQDVSRFVFRSESGYVVTSVERLDQVQQLRLMDVHGGSAGHLNAVSKSPSSIFELPVDVYGEVVSMRPAPDTNQIYLMTDRSGKCVLFVLDVLVNGSDGASTTVELSHSIDLGGGSIIHTDSNEGQKYRPYLTNTGIYCETLNPPVNRSVHFTPSFSIVSDSLQTCGIDYPVSAAWDSRLMGISDSHLIFGRVDPEYWHYISSIPLPKSVPFRTWSPSPFGTSMSNDSLQNPSGSLRTKFLSAYGVPSNEVVRQAVEFPSNASKSSFRADILLPPGESVQDYFVFEGGEFIITNSLESSAARVYQTSVKGVELKAEYPSESSSHPTLVAYDLVGGKLFVATPSVDAGGDDDGDVLMSSLSLLEFQIGDFNEPLSTRELDIHPMDSGPVLSLIFDARFDCFWCTTSTGFYTFSTRDRALRPLWDIGDHSSNWSYSGGITLVPEAPYILTPITLRWRDTSSQSFLLIHVLNTDPSDGPDFIHTAMLHVGPFDAINVERNWLDVNTGDGADIQEVSLVLWRDKESGRNHLDFNQYMGNIRNSEPMVEPPIPWDPVANSHERFTRLKWPVSLLRNP